VSLETKDFSIRNTVVNTMMTDSRIIFCVVLLCLQLQSLEATAFTRKFTFEISNHDPIRCGLRLKRTTQTANCSSLDLSNTRLSRGGASSTVAITSSKSMTAAQKKMFNLLSGGVAGTVAACITNPLEIIRTQLQSSSSSFANNSPVMVAQKVFETSGLSGFFKGLQPTLIGIIPARSIYFFTYENTKRKLGKLPSFNEGSFGNSLIAGFTAGIASNTVTNPIWMVKTRVQLLADQSVGQRSYAGYGDAVSSIFKKEGIAGFYKGIVASYWGCAEGAIQFLIYEQLKKKMKQSSSSKPPSKLQLFCSAAVAKGIAAVVTYPHEVARTRLREQAREGVFRYSGMWQTIGLIAKEEGRSGLYGGMGVHLMKVVPNSAIMFLTYEVVNIWLGQFSVKET